MFRSCVFFWEKHFMQYEIKKLYKSLGNIFFDFFIKKRLKDVKKLVFETRITVSTIFFSVSRQLYQKSDISVLVFFSLDFSQGMML